MKRNPAYRADADLTDDQRRARRLYNSSHANLMRACDVARCTDLPDPEALKLRLCVRIDELFAQLDEAKRLDPTVVERLTVASMKVRL